MSDTNEFKQWCIVEIFGHQVIAGMVSEQQIGGQAFVRVDVPAIEGRDAYTKLFGAGAIYAITPTDEATCKKAVASMNKPPIAEYIFRPTVNIEGPRQPQLLGVSGDPDDDDEWDS